jgi:hypothetical protein
MQPKRPPGVLTLLGLGRAVLVPAVVPSAPGRARSPSDPAKHVESGTIDSGYALEGELTIRLGGTAAPPAKELARRIKDSARGDASC